MADTKPTEAPAAPSAPTAPAAPAAAAPPATPEKKENLARSSIGKSAAPLRRMSTGLPQPAPKPVLRYMPTYRLEPRAPLNKEICENIIKYVVNKAFDEYQYAPKTALSLSAQVSEEIKNRVKVQNYDRYRYICVVTVGEKLMQGYYSLINFLWDSEKDGYLSYVFDNPNFFAIATLYYIYYD